MDNRTPLIAGNWKMHKTSPEAVETAKALVKLLHFGFGIVDPFDPDGVGHHEPVGHRGVRQFHDQGVGPRRNFEEQILRGIVGQRVRLVGEGLPGAARFAEVGRGHLLTDGAHGAGDRLRDRFGHGPHQPLFGPIQDPAFAHRAGFPGIGGPAERTVRSRRAGHLRAAV